MPKTLPQTIIEDNLRTYETYDALANDALSCTRCDLCQTRKNVVFCDGTIGANIMVVGEAPGANEDEVGKPFVGRGGKLLIQMFEEVGISRDEIYIANVIKCRPPENRNPTTYEISRCSAFLENQIKFVSPKVIVPVGNFAARFVLETKEGITKLRGNTFKRGKCIVIPTVHPAYVLRNGKRAQELMRHDLSMVKETVDNNEF